MNTEIPVSQLDNLQLVLLTYTPRWQLFRAHMQWGAERRSPSGRRWWCIIEQTRAELVKHLATADRDSFWTE
jgi:hypothetical protein